MSHLSRIRWRRSVWRAYPHRCYLCDKPLKYREMTMDHVVPRSAGGKNSLANLRPCCLKCNTDKSTREDPTCRSPKPYSVNREPRRGMD